MIQALELTQVGPSANLSAVFAERLNLLTGDNGLGKSFFLDVIWWTLTGTWAGNQALPYEASVGKSRASQVPGIRCALTGKTGRTVEFESVFNFTRQAWVRPQARPINPGIVIYARVDGGFSIWDPARNYGKSTPGDEENSGGLRSKAFQFSSDDLWNGLADSTTTWCNGLIRDWILWQYEPDQNQDSRFNLLKRVLEKLSPPEEKYSPGKPTRISEDARDIPTLQTRYGCVPVTHAAAGVKRVLAFAYMLVWTWSEHSLAIQRQHEEPAHQITFLVDEIEAHLHPKWQRTILPALLTTVNLLDPAVPVQLIATTHAPLVLASIEPEFDEAKDKVFLFDLQDEKIRLTDVPWTKQGDVVGWLTSDIFKFAQARSYQAEMAIEAAEAYMRADPGYVYPPDLKTKEQIHKKLLELLPGHDPFWPRWIVSMERNPE